MHYLIDESLTPCDPKELRNTDTQFAAVLTPDQWAQRRSTFELGIDIDSPSRWMTRAWSSSTPRRWPRAPRSASTICAPLTLIVGWYGMNCEHTPELTWPWSYPAVAVRSVLVVIGCISFFKHRKWL
ncbi:CorA family divalent cation transporter [Actinomyces sp.]|uniref:CorA family divalent cation transporter n=1 Tax=Actinomyces sp. TaxID=29317 RepID=UPI0026DBBE64|nr:CorA family divalent cation transporter [Actinomyces sp.]MDO4900222.1 CorA family divalent cation transporter [Actinomyces sp.]